ncbi:unnamed protein product [Penicillium pancosmium]
MTTPFHPIPAPIKPRVPRLPSTCRNSSREIPLSGLGLSCSTAWSLPFSLPLINIDTYGREGFDPAFAVYLFELAEMIADANTNSDRDIPLPPWPELEGRHWRVEAAVHQFTP